MKSSTERRLSSIKCRAISGSSLRISGCSTRTSYGHPQENALSWARSSASDRNGTPTPASKWNLLAFPEHQGVQRLVSDLNDVYRREPALHEVDFDWHGFDWINCDDAAASVLSFIRRAKAPDEFVVVVANFTLVPHERYRVGSARARITIANFSTRMPDAMAEATLGMAAA